MEQVDNIDDNCIKCGRGQNNYNHGANRMFREIVGQHVDQYLVSSKTAKTELVNRVTEQIYQMNMKFVEKQDDGTWKTMSHEKSKKKVGHRFRDAIIERKSQRSLKKKRSRRNSEVDSESSSVSSSTAAEFGASSEFSGEVSATFSVSGTDLAGGTHSKNEARRISSIQGGILSSADHGSLCAEEELSMLLPAFQSVSASDSVPSIGGQAMAQILGDVEALIEHHSGKSNRDQPPGEESSGERFTRM